MHVISFAGNFPLLLEVRSDRTSGGHCNAWCVSAIKTNHWLITATHGSRRPSDQTSWGSSSEASFVSSSAFPLLSGATLEQTSGGSLQRTVRRGHQNKTTCGSLQRMVRGGRQNKPPESQFRKRASLVHFSFSQSLRQNKPLGEHCNAWFAVTIRTNHERVAATYGSGRPSEQTSWRFFL